ncbi:hypothetical protein ACOI22_13640 [Glaciecola sp. 2405UD65-10]|uniref:hypothetical protein n=1 Tax=Glaciecola sp. 2405UD65-10 TaxID=3397244 RepID=UPI003B5C1F88
MRFLVLIILSISFGVQASNLDFKVDEGFMGAKWLDSEEEVIKALGEPNGKFKINKNRTLLIYGKSLSLLISRSQLREIKIGDVFSFNYRDLPLTKNSNFVGSNFTINGERFIEEDFSQVQKALGIELGEPDYNKNVGTDDVAITLSFSSMSMGGGDSFRLGSATFTYQL